MLTNFAFLMINDHCAPGLPDGIFSNKKYQSLFIMEGLGVENFGVFYERLVYIQVFGIFYGELVYFEAFWNILPVSLYCTMDPYSETCSN
jgi:hypothetical protein